MDVMDGDLLEFWRILNKYGVRYIMVGGFAVNMHGFIRATKDSDLWLKDDLVNRQKPRMAFDELGYGETTRPLKPWSLLPDGPSFILPGDFT